MNRIASAFWLVLAAHLAAAQPSGAQIGHGEIETRFQSALCNYTDGDYRTAEKAFQSLAEADPAHRRTSASRLMLAKSLYKLGKYKLALATAAGIYDAFPRSRYLPEADLIAGDCEFQQGRVYVAAALYARVASGKGDLRLKARAADRLGQLAGAGKITDGDVARLQNDFGKSIVAEAVAFGRARWPSRLAGAEPSRREMAGFMDRYPNGTFAALIREKRPEAEPIHPSAAGAPQTAAVEGPEEPVEARFTIGVIAPLASPPGKDMVDGILVARELHQVKSGERVALVFKDSEGSPVRAIKAAQSLVEDHGVIAIIGALTSAETLPIAALAGSYEVPLIAPTASEDGLATLSPYVFQVNATPGAQGRRIADFAVRESGLRTLATFSSRDPYGERIVKEFTARAEESGSEVIIQTWYEPGTTDYRGQLERIRDAGLALHPPEFLADEIDSLILGGIRLAPPPPVEVDPDTVQPAPVHTLEGLLIAGGKDDVLLIAPQIAFHRIHSRLLGSDGWNHHEVARDAYTDGAVFVAKYSTRSDLVSVHEFLGAFRQRFNRDQSIAAALGYDAMTAVLTAVERGGTTPGRLQHALENLGEIPGATGKISFNRGNRENSWMYLLTISDRRIQLLSIGRADKAASDP
ncbi:MAG: ABC transporter substrate-binding protein [Gemmatimonadota bacterium]|nr:ABC transporter substrate-binding protein [Gemmatimonadota bacterium]